MHRCGAPGGLGKILQCTKASGEVCIHFRSVRWKKTFTRQWVLNSVTFLYWSMKLPSDNRRLDLADQASLGHDLTLRLQHLPFLTEK